MRNKFLLLCGIMALSAGSLWAQNALQRSFKDIDDTYMLQYTTTGRNDKTPLWLQANKHGVSSTDDNNRYARLSLSHRAEADSAHKWRIGYGIDLVLASHFTSKFFVQQLYADFDYRWLRLSVGAKQRPMELKNNELSTGSQTFGINAHPIPQVRLEVPKYVRPFRGADWLALKGHFGYGLLTDGGWQQDYVDKRLPQGLAPGDYAPHYAKSVRYHSKAAYVKLGNAKRFPLTFEGGLEWATFFGGKIFNADDVFGNNFTKKAGLKDMVKAIYSGGSDENDSDYANAGGNTLGSWLARLNYEGSGWSASVYMDHFFEDHSQVFFEYGWRDALLGVEVNLPKNPIVGTVVYEYMNTRNQTGPVYHDHTAAVPDQVSGIDNYYNHTLYAGWQHWGQALGNPLFISPLYADNGSLAFIGNRFRAHHLGLKGQPTEDLSYRVMATYQSNWGTYSRPFDRVRYQTNLLFEVGYDFSKIKALKGTKATLGLGIDRGSLTGNNVGLQFTIIYDDLF